MKVSKAALTAILLVLAIGSATFLLTQEPSKQKKEQKEIVPNPQPNLSPKPSELQDNQEPLQKMAVQVAFPNLSYERMVYLTNAADGSNRLFILLQKGVILVFPNKEDVKSAEVFLDIVDRVNSAGNEEGLLGLAFDPNFKSNGYFYVYYTANPPRRSVISRFSVSVSDLNKADKTSELVLLEISQPYSYHNGGQITFGPEGYLYIGLGDGGSGGDPHGNGQSRATLLGKILRIDVSKSSQNERYRIPPDNPFVSAPNVKGEIWAYGLRNPWRFSFDRSTGLLWAADVGQGNYEEVDVVEKGGNYGWNRMEGVHCYPPTTTNCSKEGLRLPLVEYNHDEGCSVTGGYVYRGSRLKMLYGAYVYGDYCSGRIWALRYNGSTVTENLQLVDSDLEISSFGEDESGGLYILSFDGKIYSLKTP